jgi:hypothetical protein
MSAKQRHMQIKLERTVARKVAKVAVRRLVNLFLARSRRQPLRSSTLLGVGGAVGITAGWIAGRRTAHSSS